MTTVEFMDNELQKHRQNYMTLNENKAPEEEIRSAQMKLICCRSVCEVLKGVVGSVNLEE